MPEPTTLATARKCPKCNNTGELILKQPTETPELTGYVYQCNYKLCVWLGTRWVVTVDKDDKVPTRDTGHDPKRFPVMPAITKEQRDHVLDWIEDDEAKA